MSTYQNQNQFAQTPLLGQVDLIAGPNNIISAQINPASTATANQLQAGSPMKIVDAAAITDVAIGAIVYNPRKNLYVAGDTIEIGCAGTVMYLETSAAIARGASVQAATATGLIATQASPNAALGQMYDKPAAANVLARVRIAPTNSSGGASAPIAVALTSSQNATAAAVDLATAEALANALKTSYNAAQVDIAAIRTALITAGILQ